MRKSLLATTVLGGGALLAPVLAPTLVPAAGAQPSGPAARLGAIATLERSAAAKLHPGATHRLSTAGYGSAPTVVVSGLNNPRELSLRGSQDVLLVAEAGRGGDTCVGSGDDALCVGATGAVTAVLGPQTAHDQKPLRIRKGFASGSGPGGVGAVGSDGVSARTLNRIFVQETFLPPDVLSSPLPSWQSGKLLRTRPFGPVSSVANITAFEQANDPDHQGFDSDPYGVLALRHHELVTDAAGNDVLSVSRTGKVSLFAVLPNIQTGACAGQPNDNGTTGCDAVPTSLAVGRHGFIYVGGLGGETPGAGRVWVFTPTGHLVKTYRNLTTVTGVAVDRWGAVYVAEFEGGSDPNVPGDVVRISRNGSRTSVQVPLPGGIAVDAARNVYVSAFSIAPAGGLGVPGINSSGQVWRFRF